MADFNPQAEAEIPASFDEMSPMEIEAFMQMLDLPQITAIEGQPMHALADILGLLDDDELRYAVDMHNPAALNFDTDAATREELITEASARLASPTIHEVSMLDMGPSMRETYVNIMKQGIFEFAKDSEDFDETRSLLDALAMMMTVFPFEHEGKLTYVVPTEIQASFQRVIDDDFLTFAAENDMVYDYVDAATNLYGVIEVADLAKIIESHNPQELTGGPADEFLKNVISYGQFWSYYEEEGVVAHELFAEEQGLGKQYALELMEFARKIPRYIPSKEEFLKYASPDYYEDNFEADLLAELLDGFFSDTEVNIQECVLFVQDCARQGMRPEVLIETLFEDYLPGPFGNEAQANLAIKQIVKLVNTTRAWADNGRTLAEAEQLRK